MCEAGRLLGGRRRMRPTEQRPARGGHRRRSGIVLAALLVLTLAALGLPGAAMADWPLYGHDLANSRNAGADGPSASQVGSLSQAWAFTSSTGDFTGTPVVA